MEMWRRSLEGSPTLTRRCIVQACGSAYYIAPEVFSHHYTKAVDVWSLGIILYLLLSGTVPFGFDAREETEVYHSIQTDPLRMDRGWEHVSASAHELVAGLLEKDPHKRYTLEQALAHPWVQGHGATDTPISKNIIKSMQTFNRHNKFKKAALKLIARLVLDQRLLLVLAGVCWVRLACFSTLHVSACARACLHSQHIVRCRGTTAPTNVSSN